MQRMLFLAVLAMAVALGGCATRDPNLAVKGVNEFSRTPGDYTLRVNLYELDAKGLPRLVSADDASLRGFVTRTLSARGYALKAAGPARYDVAVHLLCGNMRTSDMGLMAEELRVPADAAGAGFSPFVHYWLPDAEPSQTGGEAQNRHEAAQSNRISAGSSRPARNMSAGAARTAPEMCQGRVLVVLSPASSGPAREVFVARAATEDCRAAEDGACLAQPCRSALEQTLVDLLERRF
ncbi:MAG: hypothetical protein HY916_12605 [Desulfovibrio sp.]|nr:hypothetical protein [Desulfovibrio sp.]